MATLADRVTGLKIKSYSITAPASYATGGFLVDATADFNSIGFMSVGVLIRGSLPACSYEMLHDMDLSSVEAFGKGVVKIVTGTFDKASMGNVSGEPGSVGVRSSKFAAANSTGSAHTHTMNHDHPSVTSGNESTAGTLGVLLAAGGGNMRNHNHVFDVASFSGSTDSAGSTHTHDRSFEYEHSHGNTQAATDITLGELANGTNISTTIFMVTVYGFGKS